MFAYPQYGSDGEEILSFENIWRDISPQDFLGADCFMPFAQVNTIKNRFVLELNGLEFRRMMSSLMLGAQFCYPQEWMQIYVDFIKMVHCPIDFQEECQLFPTYAAGLTYSPMNPYSNPEEVPDGYLVPPIVAVNEDNQDDYPDSLINDIIVPPNSFPLDTGWFDDIHENLPSFTINVIGEGNVNIKLLTMIGGGLVVITVDNPPNLIDIFVGIVTGADNIIDVNRDVLSVPPETAEEIIYEVSTIGAGNHQIYVVFLPIIDDSFIPIRFGGGFRSFELCGFEEYPDMGVTDVRWNDALFIVEQQKAGAYVPIGDADTLSSYLQQALDDSSLALTQNTAQDIVINNHGDRLDVIEAEQIVQNGRLDTLEAYDVQNTIDIDDLQQQITDLVLSDGAQSIAIDALDTRLDLLEAKQLWSVHYDFKSGEHGFGGGSGVTWASTVGYSWSTSPIIIAKTDSSFLDGRIAYYRLELRKVGAGEQDYTVKVVGDIYSYGVAESGLNIRYHKLQSMSGREDLELSFAAAGSWILEGLTIFGYGDSNAFDD